MRTINNDIILYHPPYINDLNQSQKKKKKNCTGRKQNDSYENNSLELELPGEFIQRLFQLLPGRDVFIDEVSHLPLQLL